MRPSDYTSYLLAKAAKTYVIENSDTLREHLQLNDLWGKLIEKTQDVNDILFSAASGIVHKIMDKQPMSFNPNTPTGIAHITSLNGFISLGVLKQDEADAILDLAIKDLFPNLLEVDYDTDVALKALYVQTPTLKTGYPYPNGTNTEHLIGTNDRGFLVQAVRSPIVNVDTLVDVFIDTQLVGTDTYSTSVRKTVTVIIPAGQEAGDAKVTREISFGHIRARGISNLSGSITLSLKPLTGR